jgi:AcrR family transcriptional regulator
MISSATTLLRERGAAATSLDDVLEHSGAPRGSVYHHFPGGRAQLIQTVLDMAGGSVSRLLTAHEAAHPITAFNAFMEASKTLLEASDFRAGCPVLAVAVEANDDAPQLIAAAANAFGSWQKALAQALERHAVPAARAKRLATLIVSAVEGAVVLARVQRNVTPLDDVARELRALLRRATSRRKPT